MRLCSIILAAAGAVSVLAAAAPARADWDDWGDSRRPGWNDHGRDRGWRDRDWRDNQRGWNRGYYGYGYGPGYYSYGYAPPVVVAPRYPRPRYYAPPPVVYGPGFGFTIR
jgi:hypothetical protein